MTFEIMEKEQRLEEELKEWKKRAATILYAYLDAISSHRMITEEKQKEQTPTLHEELLKDALQIVNSIHIGIYNKNTTAPDSLKLSCNYNGKKIECITTDKCKVVYHLTRLADEFKNKILRLTSLASGSFIYLYRLTDDIKLIVENYVPVEE